LTQVEDGSHLQAPWRSCAVDRSERLGDGGMQVAHVLARAWPRVPLERSRSKLVFLFQESEVSNQ